MVKPGNAECVLCGLRASSKNVAMRSVFPIWPDDAGHMALLEHCIAVRSVDSRDYFGFQSSWKQAVVKDMATVDRPADKFTDALVFAELIREAYKCDPTGKYLDKLFCVHAWRQDPGTARV